MSNLGKRIKEKRLARGLTQAELAALVRVDRITVSNWERNRTEPKRLHLWMLQKVLGRLSGAEDDRA